MSAGVILYFGFNSSNPLSILNREPSVNMASRFLVVKMCSEYLKDKSTAIQPKNNILVN
jgi:hypothetical protein